MLKNQKKSKLYFHNYYDHFKIRYNEAKSFEDFKIGLFAKITTLRLVQYIDKFIIEIPMNDIKIQIN